MFLSKLTHSKSMNAINFSTALLMILLIQILSVSLYGQSYPSNAPIILPSYSINSLSDGSSIVVTQNDSAQNNLEQRRKAKEAENSKSNAVPKQKVLKRRVYTDMKQAAPVQNTQENNSSRQQQGNTDKQNVQPQGQQQVNPNRNVQGQQQVNPNRNTQGQQQQGNVRRYDQGQQQGNVQRNTPEQYNQHVYTPRRYNRVEQHNQGSAIPQEQGHNYQGNHAPSGQQPNWGGHHFDNNHTYVRSGGYFHDTNQHQFRERRNSWHQQYPFMTFRLRFESDNRFPYDDLYYYPTDYIVVDSRLKVLVLPFIYQDDYSIADDITDNMISTLIDLNRFKVISRSTVDRILEQNGMYESDLADSYTAKRIGRLAGADMVIMGDIDQTVDNVTISITGIDPVTGETLVDESSSSDYTDNQSIDSLVKYLSILTYNDLPLTEGQITSVGPNRIYLNFGSDQGIDVGTRVVVYRQGYRGSRTPSKVGEAYIVAVNNDSATAQIITRVGNSRMRIGDKIIVK